MDELLLKLFGMQSIAAALAIMPDIKTKVMDDFYPESVRMNHPFSQISLQEITEIAHAVPVVRRGSQSIPIGSGSGQINFIEPQPIDISAFVSAKELNDLKQLTPDAQQVWLQSKIEFGRRTLRATAEALSCQSLTGAISFPMKIDGGMDTYTLDFGTVAVVTPTKIFNATGSTLSDVNDTLNKMAEKIEDNGFGMKVEFRCGAKVESFLVNLIGQLANDTRIIAKVTDEYIVLGKHRIKMLKGRYRNPRTKTYVNAIGDNEIQALDVESGFRFRYLAIDDLSAGLAALPMFVKTILSENPSGYQVFFKSTPLPIPVVKAMCKATVLT